MSLVNRLKHHAGLSSLPSTELDIDDALTVIKNSRRRHAIRYAVEDVGSGEVLTLSDLTDYVAQAEYGREDITGQERKRVYVGLYQRHTDDLADAGVLRPRERDHEDHVGENAEPLHALVRVCETVCGGDQ